MFKKKHLRFSKLSLVSFIIAFLIFVFSFVFFPFNTEGDQKIYGVVYETLPTFGLMDGYAYYNQNISSQEFVHFFISWISSRFVSRNLFIALSNAILAYVAMNLFLRWKTSIAIASLIILTNSYFLALYFSLERLKFGFIFLFLSFIYLNSYRIKQFCVFAVLALMSHLSVIAVYISSFFKFFTKQVLRLFCKGKIHKIVLFVFIALLIPLIFLKEHMLRKFLYYYEIDLVGTWKIMLFMVLAILYSKNKKEVITLFAPLIVAVLLVGGDRLNIFGYFLFLYYGLKYKNGWNFGVLSTSIYFAYSSVNFLINIIEHGSGFFIE